MTAPNDPTIGGTETLYRRVADSGDTSMMVTDQHTNEPRPSSGAFKMNDDGCSIYLHSVLADAGMGVKDVAKTPQNVVFSVTADQARRHSLGVVRDPWPDDVDDAAEAAHPRQAAHGLITKPEHLSKNARLKAFRALKEAAVIHIHPQRPR